MTDFIPYQMWLQEVAHPQDAICRTEAIYGYERGKFEISRRFLPSVIAEIGVRLGYSAHAFLLGTEENASYFGYDICGGPHGGTSVAGFDFVSAMLRRNFPLAKVALIRSDTQKQTEMSLSGVDLFHVDGNHSFEGAMHDMRIAWPTVKSGGVMLVDDYDYIVAVKMAVDQFIRERIAEIQYHEHLKTYRGDVIIIKR
jgi:hypothetical protein